jgi:rare lipoprotein A
MMVKMRFLALTCCAVLGFSLAACTTAVKPTQNPSQQAESAPASHGAATYKLGQPYKVNGIWYYPSVDMTYDETGIGSWYGNDFDKKYTANGEVFDQNEVSAAHKTLPLPSIVQVTNLDNGRSILVRINDRGPFVTNRIIDLSRRGAQLLGFENQGTAKVRVRVMAPETIQAQSLAKLNGSDGQPGIEQAIAAPWVPVDSQTLPPPNGSTLPAAAGPVKTQQGKGHEGTFIAEGGSTAPGPVLPQTVSVVPVSQTRIYVQAGAYHDNNNANRMKTTLSMAQLGPVLVQPVRVNGFFVYRVRLGPVATVDEADALLTKAQSIGAVESRIVID